MILAKHQFIQDGKNEMLADIAAEFRITYERTRQLTKADRIEYSFWQPVQSLFEKLTELGLNSENTFFRHLTGDIVFLNSEVINEENGTVFSSDFLTLTLSKC